MTEPQEDTDLLSQKELEDGEIEDGELNEPDCINTNDNEPEIICIDTHDDSDDLNINNKANVKNKKHNLHKKSSYRKRHLNSEEKGESILKKSKRHSESDQYSPSMNSSVNKIIIDCDDYQSETIDNSFNHDNKVETGHKWCSYESDDDLSSSKNYKQNNLKEIKNRSPIYESDNVDNNNHVIKEPHEVSKWNDYDSESESNAMSSRDKSDVKQSSVGEYHNNKSYNSWDSNKGNGENFEKNISFEKNDINESEIIGKNIESENLNLIEKSPIPKSGWGSYDSPNGGNEESKKSEVKVNENTDNFGKWGSYKSPVKESDNSQKWGSRDTEDASLNNNNSDKWGSYNTPEKTNDDNQKWGSRDNEEVSENNNNSSKWGSYDSPERKNDDNQKWGSRDYGRENDNNDNSNKWGSRDNGRDNDNDNSNKWGSRKNGRQNDNNNFNKWGSYDNSEKGGDNGNRWNSRDNRKDNENDSQKWGSRDGSRRNNFRRRGSRDGSRRNNSFRRWGDGNQNGNQKWGSNDNNNDDKKWGSNYNDNNNDDKKWGSNYNDNNNDDNKWGSNYNDNNNDDRKWGSNTSNSPQRNDNNNKGWTSSDNVSPQRTNDDNVKWGSPTDTNQSTNIENPIPDSCDVPEKSAWGAYDSDDDMSRPTKKNITSEPRTTNESNSFDDSSKCLWESQDSGATNNKGNNDENSNFSKWGSFESDDEDNSKNKSDRNVRSSFDGGGSSNKTSWGEESTGTYGDHKSQSNYSNSGFNRNDRNESKNDKNKRWSNRNDGEKPRNVCKYFSMGSCRHGDRCTFLHESPNKQQQSQQSGNQESKKKELCKFYEHQQCYKRANCVYMHEEFPCKLFHAGSKMCPSGDGCKYSHSPLNQETKTLLEKYLDEKIDGRTEKNDSDWNSMNKKSTIEDDIDNDDGCVGFDPPEAGFPDPSLRFMYPGTPDMMRFPTRPWNSMMRFNDMAAMPVPRQMEMMHRQRLLCQYPMNVGRMLSRGFRGMVPPNMHEGFPNGIPYPMPPIMGGAGVGHQKMHSGSAAELKDKINVSDPYIDNLAQLVVSKDLSNSPKRLIDMLDPNIQCEDIDDFNSETETSNSKKNLSSPVMLKSPEIPPGAYVPRTSMNIAQPNVRLGPGSSFGAGGAAGGEQAILYGGFPGHPNESAMMDLINFSAIHYYHNHPDPIGYDIPWKLVLIEVPIKIPYPLMDIETEDLLHKYSDPRLKGHPSVLNANTANDEPMTTMTTPPMTSTNQSSTYRSQLSSPGYLSAGSETCGTLTPLNDFMSPKPDLGVVNLESSMLFPVVSGSGGALAPPGLVLGGVGTGELIGVEEDIFNFHAKPKVAIVTAVEAEQRISSDRSYLQDPRFKRKKAVVTNPANMSVEFSDME